MRFVKAAAAKRTPPTRSWSSAWDDTSIAHAVSPASTMRRKSRCRSTASAVVRTAPSTVPPIRRSIVPSSPVAWPAAVRIACWRNAVVVLPFVPVTPSTVSCSVGCPKKTSAIGPIAARTDGTTPCGTGRSSSRSTTSAQAPAATAAAAWSCPSVVCPGTQRNSVPGVTARES